jgi:calcineurin-like phosphoesterase family protein
VKILALSDEVVDFIYSPRVKEQYADVDLVIGCGDLPFYYLEFIVTMLNVPVYYVPGNHDRRNQYLSDGRVIHRAEGCEALDGGAARVRDPAPNRPAHDRLLLAGLGGSLRYNLDAQHQYTQSGMTARAVQLVPTLLFNRLRFGRYLDILVTHAPPRSIHDAPDPAHTGFDVFLRLMRLFKPRLLLHGHMHLYRQDTGYVTRYEQTDVVNVYPYRVIEL